MIYPLQDVTDLYGISIKLYSIQPKNCSMSVSTVQRCRPYFLEISNGMVLCRPFGTIPAILEVIVLYRCIVMPEKILPIFSTMLYIYGDCKLKYIFAWLKL